MLSCCQFVVPLRLVGILVVVLLAAANQLAAKPNVVVFFTDDQGTLDANCYGSDDLYTPTMDKLAATGVRFTQAYSHVVCCPARAMLMTGRYPQRSGIVVWTQPDMKWPRKGRNMPASEVTLAESLKSAGYRTALFGKWHLGAHRDHGPKTQGFDEFFGHRGGFIDNYRHYALHRSGFHDLYEGTTEIHAKGSYFPDMVTERTLKFIDANKDQPFFIYVAFNIPHYPEQADEAFAERYEKLKEPRRSYAKIVSTTDDRMGRIVDHLERHNLREDTIIVFMSDNGHSVEDYKISVDNHNSGLAKGTNYGANGGGGNIGKWRGHKGTYYEGGIRVPAIISYPAKLPQGVVRNQAITAMDWMPTILDLCSVPKPDVELDGASLLPIIQSADSASHYDVMHWGWQAGWAVRRGDWKLIGTSHGPQGLYSLADPEPERTDYRQQHPELVEELLNLHREWRTTVTPPK